MIALALQLYSMSIFFGRFIMNKEMILSYPCIFNEENGEYWGQFLAPLDGVFSRGNTLAECIENAKEALGFYLEDLEEYPKFNINLREITLNQNQILSYVSINMKEYLAKYSNKSVKKTLSIPAWLNTKAERANVNFSQILQKALIEELKVDKI